jgi:hypothetical protein
MGGMSEEKQLNVGVLGRMTGSPIFTWRRLRVGVFIGSFRSFPALKDVILIKINS